MQTQTHTSTTWIVISFYHCSSSSCPRTDPRRIHRAAVLQRCRPRRRALGSQARAQGRGVAGEPHWRRRGRGAAADGRRDGVQRWWRRGSAGVPARRGRRGFEGRNRSQGGRRCSPREKSKGGSPEMMNRSSLAATMEVVTALVEGQKGARVSAKGGARAQWRRKGRPVRIRPGGGRTRHGSRRWPARGDACGAQRGKTEREGRGG